ncbi:MAG: substrate-binding domain-containing protein, partial [Anaerolineaceae bacterium]|nr:substrate-binding domain-containing protein [Anaerolineaceae bacterium]
AVFICNDLMALGAFRTLRYANKRVPYDISIVGFDDITLASEMMPPLTTVAQPIVELATLAADLLITRIQNEGSPQPPIRTTLEPSLVLRDSCAKFSGER